MSKLIIPQGLKGKDLFNYLATNKSDLIAEKKSILKYSDPLICAPSIVAPTKIAAVKDDGVPGTATPISDAIDVKVVMNTANWCDNSMDVLLADCWAKSIKENGSGTRIRIPHLANHTHKIEAKVGKVKSIYAQDMRLKDLGVNMNGSTQCLIFETTVLKSYNEFIYNQYKDGEIDQHSIGLFYVLLVLCINDKDFGAEYEAWQKYYDFVINKDVIDERGYFWAVPEIKLIEGSSVLFGCNELTPTLGVSDSSSSVNQPSSDTGKQSQTKTGKAYDINQLLTAFN